MRIRSLLVGWQSREGAWAEVTHHALAELRERMRFIDTLCWQAVQEQEYGYLDRLVVIHDGTDVPAVASRLDLLELDAQPLG